MLLAFTLTTNVNAQAPASGKPATSGHTNGHDGGVSGHQDDKPGQRVGHQHGDLSIPLDGGLSILLAGAAFFGIRKLRQK